MTNLHFITQRLSFSIREAIRPFKTWSLSRLEGVLNLESTAGKKNIERITA